MVKVNTEELNHMELLKSRDPRAISALYDQYAPALYGIIFRIVKSEEKADSLLEQTFLLAVDNMDEIKSRSALFSSMCRVARTNASALALLNVSEHGEPVVGQNAQSNKNCSELIEGMDSQCEQVINHLYLGGYSVVQTSQVLNMTEDKVKSQFRCALTHIQNKINGGSTIAPGVAVIMALFTPTLLV